MDGDRGGEVSTLFVESFERLRTLHSHDLGPWGREWQGDPSRVTGSSSSADMKSLPAPLIALAIEAFRLWSMSATRATPQCPDQHLPRGP